MTATNDFLPFAVGGSANVVTQSAYAALSTLLANGFQAGIANSQQLNKVWRQSSIMAAVLGTIIQQSGQNATDDGTTSTLVTNLKAAIMGSKVSVNAVTGAVTLTNANAGQSQVLSGSPAYAVTLPLANTCAAGAVFSFINVGTANVTIQRQGSSDVLKPNATGITSMVLTPGDTLELESDGSGVWYAIDGSAILPYSGVMSGANWTTPAQFDNTTKLATTEFVRKAGLQASGVDAFNSNSTLTASSAGKVILAGNFLSSITLTLPLTSSVDVGSTLTFYNIDGANTVTVQRQGADNVWISSSNVTSMVMQPGDSYTLVKESNGNWYGYSGSSTLKYSGLFKSSISNSGYQKLPSGLIIQWGNAGMPVGTNVTATITYPIAFPNAQLAVTATIGDNVASSLGAVQTNQYNNASKTQVTIYCPQGGYNARWIAIGW